MLTQKAFKASQRFIEASARPLEIARFHHVFNGASGNLVFAALKKFQNADGGFGHALEPDLRTKESSVLGTSIAFQIILATESKPGPTFVSTSLAYLLSALNKTTSHWRIIPEVAEQSPRAPWWNQANRENGFNQFSLNPTSEILGYLFDYQEQIPESILTTVSEQVINHLSNSEEIEMHSLLCCLRLLETKNLPAKLAQLVHQKLKQTIDQTISTDPAQWQAYTLRPLLNISQNQKVR